MTSAQNADTAAILQANRDQSRWLIEADIDRLDDLLDDDFTAVHITGYEQSKGEWLNQIRSGAMAYHDVQEQSASVTIDGDTAVLTAKNLITATIYGARGTWPLQSTTTYAKKTDGGGQPVPAPPPTDPPPARHDRRKEQKMRTRNFLVPVTAAGLILAGCTGPTTVDAPPPPRRALPLPRRLHRPLRRVRPPTKRRSCRPAGPGRRR